MVKIFITGAGGMVASHLIDLCLEKGDEVWASYRWNEDLRNIEHIKDNPKLIIDDDRGPSLELIISK